MTASVLPAPRDWRRTAPVVATVVAFVALFWEPAYTLGRDWLTYDDAAHGLLLAPLALWLAWRRGRAPGAVPQPILGLVVLAGAVLLRYVSGLGAELFTMRLSLVGGAIGLIVSNAGLRQLTHWWLPGALLLLSIPLPAVLLGSLALPLQLQASRMGAWLLEWRHVPVFLAGNVIHLADRALFVTEACSGLRSLTALLALGVLVGGIWLRTPLGRAAVIVTALPLAVVLNGIRVFLTGFSVTYISPAFGEGVMHYTEGWLMFALAFGLLGLLAWGVGAWEGRWRHRPARP